MRVSSYPQLPSRILVMTSYKFEENVEQKQGDSSDFTMAMTDLDLTDMVCSGVT
jgi:hypothetical protein